MTIMCGNPYDYDHSSIKRYCLIIYTARISFNVSISIYPSIDIGHEASTAKNFVMFHTNFHLTLPLMLSEVSHSFLI